ncbi:MAG TPA: chloride channel protein [Ferrovibrio sp.]|uniref:chloride channel protein n=1 Tax=Ferrovibrio sp. TaxID=1917215 RepID=UPI002ED581DE
MPHSTHLLRRVWFNRYIWQRRGIFWIGGLLVGLAAVLFVEAADFAQSTLRLILRYFPYAPLILTPAGLAFSLWVTRRYFPNSQGSGIPQAIAARHLADQDERSRLLSLRIAIGKILLTVLALGVGASVGREGPTVQVGASIMHALGKGRFKKHQGLVLAGSAAGIAAAFNTPLAGLVFGIEEMSRSFEHRFSGFVLGSIIAAGLVSLFFLGDYVYFGHTAASVQSFQDIPAVFVCGVAGGILGGLFSRILLWILVGPAGRLGSWMRAHPIAFAALCGLGTAICGLLSEGTTYATGYSEAKSILTGEAALPWQFGILKMVATTLSSICGIPGGIFSPSLAIGAGFGANVAALLPQIDPSTIVLLFMVSYLAGVVQAPITSFVIVMEMTSSHGMILPLMAASILAFGTSRLLCPTPVYHGLAENFIRNSRMLRASRRSETEAEISGQS